MSDERNSRQQEFAQLSDQAQADALRLVKLYRENGRERQFLSETVLYPGPLSAEVKGYLMGLLKSDIEGMVHQAFAELSRIDNARSDARDEAARLGYDWKKRRNHRKHLDRYRDDLDYYSEILASERRPTPSIAAYVTLLHERYDTEDD